MGKELNPALVALSLVLEDASSVTGTFPEDILVHLLELRSLTTEPSPLPPGFFIRLSHGLEYFADMQGNFSQVQGTQGAITHDGAVQMRLKQPDGIVNGLHIQDPAPYQEVSIEDGTFLNEPLAVDDDTPPGA